jgi:hypothetical protein
MVLDKAAFERIVRGGAPTANRMPAYADFSGREFEGIRHDIRQQAENALAQAGAVTG